MQVAAGTFQQHTYTHQHLPIHSHSLHPAYVTSYAASPYAAGATFPASAMQGLGGGQLYHTSPPHLRQLASSVPTAMQLYPATCQVTTHTLPTTATGAVTHIHALHPIDTCTNPGTSTVNSGQPQFCVVCWSVTVLSQRCAVCWSVAALCCVLVSHSAVFCVGCLLYTSPSPRD